MATSVERIVLLGCPSLVSVMEAQGKKGLLLERNPNHHSTQSFIVHRCDLRCRFLLPELPYKFELGILDSPWYLDDLFTWLNVALPILDIGRAVLFVLWPETIRPTAPAEHQTIFSALSSVGVLEQVGTVTYDTPFFEKLSLQQAGKPTFLRSGLLMKLTKLRSEKLIAGPTIGPEVWRRFGIGKAQVAIKLKASADTASRTFFIFGSALHSSDHEPTRPLVSSDQHLDLRKSCWPIEKSNTCCAWVGTRTATLCRILEGIVQKRCGRFGGSRGDVMGTPRVMLRFRDEAQPVISAHNDIFDAKGSVFWGLWLKSFEDKSKIVEQIKEVREVPIYVADTASKAKPSIHICDVKRVVWPAAGFVDTEIRCLTELESGDAEKEVQPRV